MTTAIDIIHDEHRAIAAVLKSLEFIVAGIAAGRFEPDFQLLSAIVDYLGNVPDQVHHPKEDKVLFARVREQYREGFPVLAQLEEDHRASPQHLLHLAFALIHYQAVGAPGFEAFQTQVTRYLQFNWKHLDAEEQVLLPLLRHGLSADDWATIDAEFAAHREAWSVAEKAYEKLFTQIVNAVPAPMGLGHA